MHTNYYVYSHTHWGGRGRRNTHITIIGTIVLHTLWGGGDGEPYIRVAEGGERNNKGGTEKRTFQNRDRVTY